MRALTFNQGNKTAEAEVCLYGREALVTGRSRGTMNELYFIKKKIHGDGTK